MLTFDDVHRLDELLERTTYSDISLEVDGLHIQVTRSAAPGVPANTRQTGAPASAATTVDTASEARPHVLRAPGAGRIVWTESAGRLKGRRVVKGDRLATVTLGSTYTEIVSDCAGVVSHVQPLQDDAFVQYAQWLLTITPE